MHSKDPDSLKNVLVKLSNKEPIYKPEFVFLTLGKIFYMEKDY